MRVALVIAGVVAQGLRLLVAAEEPVVPSDQAGTPPPAPRRERGRAPEPTAEFLWLPPSGERNGDASAGQRELRLRVGAPPWWRSGDGRFGTVLGAGYAQVDPLQTNADLPQHLRSYYLNSVTFWNISSTLNASLIVTPGLRTADASLDWKDTRLFTGAFLTWKLDPQLDLGIGVISTSNHMKTVTIPTATAVIRPSDEVTIWFQGISGQVEWQASPTWTFGTTYSLISSLDFQLPAGDPNGEIILTRDVRIAGSTRWSGLAPVSLGAVAGIAFNRRWQWEGDGNTRTDLLLQPTAMLGVNFYLAW